MKKNSASKSAFFNLRVLLAFVLGSIGVFLVLLGFGIFPGSSVWAQGPKQNQKVGGAPQLVPMVGPVSQDLDLRALPEIPQVEEENEQPLKRYPFPRPGKPATNDPIRTIRKMLEAVAMPTPSATYPGITSAQSGCGCLPPDTDGDVGPNHYIQAVNSRIKILDKSGNQLLAPTTYNSFFSALGAGNPCGNNNNDGDGIAFYDHLADRWVVSDFAFPGFPGTAFYQCIGVSKTSDPVAGGWWLYAVQVDSSNSSYLGDYPKFGMWPDAYYFAVNLFSNNTTFNGVRVFALPRNDMINGTGAPDASAVAFSIDPATLGDVYSLVPASFRTGSAPPAGAAEYFLAVNSSSVAGTAESQVFAWQFHVDFVTPANSTFGIGANHAANGAITVIGFVDAFTSSTEDIVPQSGTSRLLDTLGDKIMYPLVYQNLGGTESLWADQTINNNQNGTGPTAVRWYQFNVTGGVIPATPAQQQTWNNGNDGLWRWMPSIAVDGQGNMAIGYSTSSSSIFASSRYAGRLAGDPANDLGQGEAVMQAGGGAQTNSTPRWGDYSSLFVDPSDNATFWHTNEYYSASSSASWNTRIGTFKFPIQTLTQAASRMTHGGGAGTFDMPLPLNGSGIEPRSDGTGNYTLVLTFTNPVTGGTASVTSGSGSASNVTFNSNQMIVTLTGVTDQQVITVSANNVAGTNTQTLASASVNVGFLNGDVNGDKAVNAGDTIQVRDQSGATLDATNFQYDVNVDGFINAGDATVVRSKSGDSLP